MLPVSIFATVAQLIQIGAQITPVIQAAVQTTMDLSGSKDGPTPEQQAAIDAGLDAAHTALQAAQPS